MKRAERHHLKENEVANWVLETKQQIDSHRSALTYGLMGLVVLAAAVLGTMAWRSSTAGKAASMLAEAMTVAESPVTSPVAGEGNQLPVQPAGTFPSEKMRLEAALPKFIAVADAYPGDQVGLMARYRAASTLIALGRYDEGIRHYREVMAKGSGVLVSMAKLGLADAQLSAGRFDEAAAALKELADKPADGVPLDGVLMQLGRAYGLAGKAAESRKMYQRVVDEFPTSVYASEARREVDAQ